MGFELAIRLESGRLFAVAYSILRDVQEAEDAVQETMELAWKSWSDLKDPTKRGAWLRQICVRRSLRLRRHILRRLWLADRHDADRSLQDPLDPDLDRSYRRLSRQQRAVIALHYQYGYSLDECADMMACAPGTARSHLARGLAALRKDLDHE
jgi:RNA polymerase sigma factor (sigma-70 family)